MVFDFGDTTANQVYLFFGILTLLSFVRRIPEFFFFPSFSRSLTCLDLLRCFAFVLGLFDVMGEFILLVLDSAEAADECVAKGRIASPLVVRFGFPQPLIGFNEGLFDRLDRFLFGLRRVFGPFLRGLGVALSQYRRGQHDNGEGQTTGGNRPDNDGSVRWGQELWGVEVALHYMSPADK